MASEIQCLQRLSLKLSKMLCFEEVKLPVDHLVGVAPGSFFPNSFSDKGSSSGQKSLHSSPQGGPRKCRRKGAECRSLPGDESWVPANNSIHCACALSLSPHFKFCRMSQSLGQKNPSPALRGCAFLLHLSVTRNQDPISFECLSSRAHFSSFLVNVSAPGCPVHRICCACASTLTSPQPWS